MNRFRALVALIWRAWPALLPAALAALWWFVACRWLPSQFVPITKGTSAAMQAVGLFVALHSINANLGLLRGHSLKSVFVGYMKELPAWFRLPRDVTVGLTGVGGIGSASASLVTAIGSLARVVETDELARRIAALEAAA